MEVVKEYTRTTAGGTEVCVTVIRPGKPILPAKHTPLKDTPKIKPNAALHKWLHMFKIWK